jgi:ABC-type nitrate/sulfonate/bicarbonate transport system substrate-binding protein
VSRSADVGNFGGPAIITANLTGAKLQVFHVANETGNMEALYVNAKSGIKSAKDLRGKTVATIKNSTPDIVLHYALAQAGVPFSEVTVKYLDGGTLVPAFARGDVDAVWAFNSIGARLISEKAELVQSASDLGLPDPTSFMASQEFISANKDALRRFAAAIMEASETTNKNPEVSRAALIKYAGLTAGQADIVVSRQLSSGRVRTDLLSSNSKVSLIPGGGLEKFLKVQAETLQKMGAIASAPDVSTMVTDTVVR